MKWFAGHWPLFQGLLLVMGVTLVGILPPTIMDEIRVRLTPDIPWVALVALIWMWLLLKS